MRAMETPDDDRRPASLHLQRWPAAGRRARHGADRARPGRAHRPLRGPAAAAQCRRLARRPATTSAATAAARAARGAIAGPHSLLADLGCGDRRACARGGRLVLLGHSLGGLVAARFVAEGLRARPARWSRASTAWCCRRRRSTPGMKLVQKYCWRWRRRAGADLAPGQRPEAGVDLPRPRGRAPLRRRPAGARPRHAAAGALHRRRRRAGARPRAAHGGRRRC